MKSPPEKSAVSIKQALQSGDILKAFDLASSSLTEHPEDLDLLHSKALALLTLSGPDAALDSLEQHQPKPSRDIEIECLRARIQKDRWSQSGNIDEVALAASLYLGAWDLDPENEYPAINAATCLCLSNCKERARDIANEVKRICDSKLLSKPNDYYAEVSLAEANAILGNYQEARSLYERAASRHPHRIRDLASAQKQAQLIAAKTTGDRAIYDGAFPQRRIVILRHKPIDDFESRFTVQTDTELDNSRRKLSQELTDHPSTIGLSCLTSIEELAFLELLKSHNRAYHVFLPWPTDDILNQLVPISYHERFHSAIAHAESVRTLS